MWQPDYRTTLKDHEAISEKLHEFRALVFIVEEAKMFAPSKALTLAKKESA